MRFTLLLCVLASTLAQAQQSSMSSPAQSSSQPEESSSSAAPADSVPSVVKLASQKVTIPAARIPLTTLDGKEVHLGDFDAKVVVVSLWGTISRDNSFLAQLEMLRQSYKGKKDVVILAINVDLPRNADDVQVIRDVAKEMGATYPMLIDKELKLLALVNEKLRPTEMERNTFLIPRFLLFTQKFEKMEQPPMPTAEDEAGQVKELRNEIEKVRLRKK
ncbi:TlpA disulfide reductase family protein [Hyalangium versicolor]|uniref:TlpA disulfide reductase family protein n=1 Tax=Hyalangium versicolor TaxID=2861190 RepID=UPI001CCF0EFC|nr:TlpA disulfide reductase family protein [Hyalangium versicolor]